MNIKQFDFIDFGASKGGMIDFAIKKLGGKKGLGIDIDPKKVKTMKELGYDCEINDFTKLTYEEKSVNFITMSHTLEHLPGLELVREAIASASKIAKNFLFIQGPFFDADDKLKELGLMPFYSNWYGHRCHLKVTELQNILHNLNLYDYEIFVRKPILDSKDPCIQSLSCPADQHFYDEKIHPKKPNHNFSFKAYQEFLIYVKLSDFPEWNKVLKARNDTFPLPSEYIISLKSSDDKSVSNFNNKLKKLFHMF